MAEFHHLISQCEAFSPDAVGPSAPPAVGGKKQLCLEQSLFHSAGKKRGRFLLLLFVAEKRDD